MNFRDIPRHPTRNQNGYIKSSKCRAKVTKMAPKSDQNGSQNYHFGSILGALGGPVGNLEILGSIWGFYGVSLGPLWGILGGPWLQKGSQNEPKSVKNRCLFLDRFWTTLLKDFGITFGAFFDHFLINYGETMPNRRICDFR